MDQNTLPPADQEAVDTLQDEYLKVMIDNASIEAQARTRAASDELGTGPQNVNYVKPERQILAEALLSQAPLENTADVTITGDAKQLQVKRKDGSSFTVDRVDEPVSTQRVFDLRQQMLARDAPQKFDFDSKISEIRNMPASSDRQDQASITIGALDGQAADRMRMIQSIAAQKSGVNAAQDALVMVQARHNQAVLNGVIPPGAVSVQVHEAQKQLQQAQLVANQQELDMAKSDPVLIQLKGQKKQLEDIITFTESRMNKDLAVEQQNKNREENAADRAERKAQERLRGLPPGASDSTTLSNVAAALGMKNATVEEVQDAYKRSWDKEPAMRKVAEMNRNNSAVLLTDPDPKVRDYAVKILKEYDMTRIGEDKGTPKYITDIEKLVKDPTALMTVADKQAMTKEMLNKSTSAAEKAQIQARYQAKSLDNIVAEISRNRVADIGAWNFSMPEFKTIIDELKAKSKNGKVLQSDAFDAIIKTTIPNPLTKQPMTFREKANVVSGALYNTLLNETESLILPSVENQFPLYNANVTNQFTRAFVRSRAGIFSNPISTVLGTAAIESGYSLAEPLQNTSLIPPGLRR